MFVSFIIPTYNSSAYIIRCLSSIYSINLGESEYEIIVVDDCSIDDTISVVKDFVHTNKHSNLVLLKQNYNNRQGTARNRGVSVAKGKYIVFVDSDDEIDSSEMLSAIQYSQELNLEMCCLRFAYVNESGNIIKKSVDITSKLPQPFTGRELQKLFPYWNSAPWGYIFRKSFLHEVNYPFAEGVIYEDSDFVQVHLFYAKLVGYFSELTYKTYYNPKSTTHSLSYKNVSDYLLLGTRMVDFYETVNDSSDYACSLLEGGLYNIGSSLQKLFKLNSYTDIVAFYERIDAIVSRQKYINYQYPYYLKSKWIYFSLKHKNLVILIMFFVLPMIRFYLFLKHFILKK